MSCVHELWTTVAVYRIGTVRHEGKLVACAVVCFAGLMFATVPALGML